MSCTSLPWSSGHGEEGTKCGATCRRVWRRRRDRLRPGAGAGGERTRGGSGDLRSISFLMIPLRQKSNRGMRRCAWTSGEEETKGGWRGLYRGGQNSRKRRRPCGTTARKLGDLGHESERAFGGNRWRRSRAFFRNKRRFKWCCK